MAVKVGLVRSSIMDADQIAQLLPHGPTKRRVSGIYEVTDKYASGFFDVTPEVCRDHFAGFPVLPRVDLEEAIAQVGIIVIQTQFADLDLLPMFAGQYSGRHYHAVYPGQRIEIYTQLDGSLITRKNRPCGGKASGRVSADGRVVHEHTFSFQLIPRAALDRLISRDLK